MSSGDRQFYEKLSKKELSEQEVFEAKHNLVSFFDLLFQIDKRIKDEKKVKNKNDSEVCSAGST